MEFMEGIEYIGIIAFALSGFYVATKDRLDLLGIFIASFLTALGGGITRDALASKVPYTFTHLAPGLLVIGVLVFATLFKLYKHSEVEQKFFFVLSDTLGLVSFAISGAMVGIESGYNYFGVVLLALITAVGGGVLRDVLLNKVPLILSTGLYGTVALLVGSGMYLCYLANFLHLWVIFLIGTIGLVVRLLAYYRSWHLPVLK